VDTTRDVDGSIGSCHWSDDADRIERLRRTIETEIIPRLMLAAKSPAEVEPSVEQVPRDAAVLSNDVTEFTALLLDASAPEVRAFVARLTARGVPRHGLLLDLFAPAARHLGWLWETDACNFAVVTMAMGSLQQALRMLDPDDTEPDLGDGYHRRSIFLAPGVGEQHSFPVQMLDVFFRRAGWAVESELAFDPPRLCADLRKRHLDAVGLSVSRDCLLDRLASDIQRLRRASRNKSLVVLVGGCVFRSHPEFVARVGADATASDARNAVLIAESMVPAVAGA
jgi:methanogenic corrinoid protein MtbC1